ncbi:MAG: ABC transporter ATP-binding protein [Planctomycetota bacterium]
MSDAVVDVQGLVKRYDQRPVLRGLDLRVEPGQLLGLIGPNGAGKSTLLRTLVGLVERSDGAVRMFGLDPQRDALAIRRRTSYLPGETGVYQQMRGAAFLDFALGFYPRHDTALRDELLDAFALPLNQRVRSYSAGMKQKIALVATLVPDVDLYLLDEPDRALDASVRFFVRDVLRRVKQRGKTIVLSSHHLSEVETLADRLEFLLDGALVPAARVRDARLALRRQPRIRLHDGHTLPPGAQVVREEPDGMLVVQTDDDAVRWLQTAPAEAIASAEIGVDRLEDLYQLLLRNRDDASGTDVRANDGGPR